MGIFLFWFFEVNCGSWEWVEGVLGVGSGWRVFFGGVEDVVVGSFGG